LLPRSAGLASVTGRLDQEEGYVLGSQTRKKEKGQGLNTLALSALSRIIVVLSGGTLDSMLSFSSSAIRPMDLRQGAYFYPSTSFSARAAV